MADPATWATIATTVGGAVASSALQNQANKRMTNRQEELNRQSSAYESQKAAEGRTAIERYLETVTPQARAEQQATTQQDLTQQLTRGAEGVQGFAVPEKVAGNLSTDYGRVREQTQAAASDRLKKAISNLAVIGTPATTELNRAIAYGRTGSDVANAAQAGQNVAARYGQAIGLARPDPNLAFAGQVVAGVTPTAAQLAGGLVKPKVPAAVGGKNALADASNIFASV